MLEQLIDLLKRVVAFSGQDFSGLGVIVQENDANLPVFPLRVDPIIPDQADTAEVSAEISHSHNDLHDGFHLLTTDLLLSGVAQYFSPPIVEGVELKRERRFGGRYLAALFGSVLPGVKMIGIATPTLGIAIFENGREIHFEEL